MDNKDNLDSVQKTKDRELEKFIDTKKQDEKNKHSQVKPIKKYSNSDATSGSNLRINGPTSRTHYDGFSIHFEDLIVWVPEKKGCIFKHDEKDILRGVSSKIAKGSMTAIVGPSGSGKTTLINYLAGRQNESQMFRSYCRYYINGSKIENVNYFKNIIGYVLQEDIMEHSFTPRELLSFYARMRGIKNVEERVGDVLALMSLEHCADTIVGNAYQRGLSGGERKRTNIAIELISDPNLLFLDEPTTGLDSFTALEVMRNLAELKTRGITIISTIHSPSKEVLDLFDQVIMLVDGSLVYDGKPSNMEKRLNLLGMKVPWDMEPIEYFMKIIDKDILKIQFETAKRDIGSNGEILQKEHEERINKMVKMQAKETKLMMDEDTLSDENLETLMKLAKTKNQKLNLFRQFILLLSNSTKVFFKDIYGVIGQSVIFWILAVIFILIFVDLADIENDTIKAIQNRAGFVFIIGINFFFIGTNMSSTLFIPRKRIFLKDKQSRLYDDSPFFLSAQLYSLPLLLINIALSLVIIYFAVGLNNDPGTNYLWYFAFLFLGSFFGGGAFGMILGVIAEKIEHLVALVPAIVWPQLIVVGYFANVESMTWPLYIFSFTSPARYTFQGLILTEFSNRERYINSCKMTLRTETGNEYVISIPESQKQGCDPMQVFDFKEDTKWFNLVIVLIIVFGVRILAFLLFKYKYRERDAILAQDQKRIDKYSLQARLVNAGSEK